MKKLLIIALLSLAAYTTQAQTNIQYRITIDGVNTSWNFDAGGTKKDQARIAGIIYAYSIYTASVPTNEVALAMGPWLKRQHLVLVDDYTNQKQTADNATRLAKLQYLLTQGSDLLLNADFTDIDRIVAKAP